MIKTSLRVLFLLLGLSLGYNSSAFAANKNVNLIQIWNLAKSNNANIKASELRTAGKDSEKTATYLGILPSLNLDLSTSRNNSRYSGSEPVDFTNKQWSINLRQPLIDFSLWEQIHTASIETQIAKVGFDKVTYDLRFTLADLFVSILAIRQQISLYKVLLETDLKNAEKTILAVEATGLKGAINSSFELSRLSLLKQKAARLTDELLSKQQAMAEILNVPCPEFSGDLLRISLDVLPMPNAGRLKSFSEQLSDLEIQRLGSLSKQERLRFVPTLFGFASRIESWADQSPVISGGHSVTYSTGLGLSWTISSGIRAQYSAQSFDYQATALTEVTNSSKKSRGFRMQSLAQSLQNNYRNAREARALGERGIKILLAARDQQKAGMLSMTQFASTIISAADVYSSAVDSVANYLKSQLELSYEGGDFGDNSLILLNNVLEGKGFNSP